MRISNAVFAVLAIVAVSATGTLARQVADKCAEVKYLAPGRSAYPYRVRSIEGQAVYGAIEEKREFQSAAAVCVALFNRKDTRLVAGVTTESGGQFNFPKVAAGKYVLVLSVGALHELFIPVEVSERVGFKHWGLLLHLRAKEDPRKSFVTPITQPVLRQELLKLVQEDQVIRDEIIRYGADRKNEALESRAALIAVHSSARMKEIVNRYGWPGPELIGQDGADAAFLLVQHSPDLSFQEAMLPLVRRSYESGKLSAWNYALLLDRVLTLEGKPQIYGMALKPWTGKEPELYPIKDEANVDQRRAKIGLPPLREYLESMKRLYFPP